VAFKLKTYEGQAKVSVLLAVLGGLALVGVLALICRNFDLATWFTTYNPNGFWLPILGVGLLAALAASTIGFFVGLHSAGQRRNTRSALAWLGFFVNALIITAALSSAALFVFTRNPIVPK
jgi:prepilin signal peptidase PulO-like enzyme (type II secretory pathway)